MSSPTSSGLLRAALIFVSVLALAEAAVIVYLLSASGSRTTEAQVPNLSNPAPSARVTDGTTDDATPYAIVPTAQSTPDSANGALPRGKVGETIESGGFALTVRGTYHEPDADLQNIFDFGDDEQYIAADLVLENRSNDSFFYASSQFKLKDAADFEYVETLDYRQPAFGFGTMGPGERVRGYVSFVVPRSASGLSLIFQPGAGSGYRTIYISLGQ